jgi:hypothetical protein
MIVAQLLEQCSSVFGRIARLALLVAIANAPFWILSAHAFLARGLISLDSIVCLAILELSVPFGLLAISLSWAADLVVSASSSYHFATPAEFVRSVAYAGSIRWANFLSWSMAATALPFAVAFGTLAAPSKRRIGPVVLIAAAAVLLLVDSINGSSAISHRDVRVLGTNIAGSSAHALVLAAMEAPQQSTLSPVSTDSGGLNEVGRYLPPETSTDASVLFVIVESMGVHNDPVVRQWLQDQLFPQSLAGRYTLAHQNVVSRGGTASGEMRRLCGLEGSYRALTEEAGQQCIPTKYAGAGWNTLGLHGFSENMFDRRFWWPTIGLQELRFAEQLGQDMTRRCGAAFHGICDQDLLAIATSRAQRPKTFVYALTLNSHLPLAPLHIEQNLADVCSRARAGDDVCTLLAYISTALRALSSQLGSQPASPYVIVVGDHPPPFFEIGSRTQFAAGIVPMFILTPRAAHLPSDSRRISPLPGGIRP